MKLDNLIEKLETEKRKRNSFQKAKEKYREWKFNTPSFITYTTTHT